MLRVGPIDHDKRTRALARLLAEAGSTVTVVSTGSTSRLRTVEPGGYSVHEIAVLPASQHSVWVVRVAKNLLQNAVRPMLLRRAVVQAVKEARPDIVHCVNVEMLSIGARAAGSRPYIYDSREHFATTGTVSRRTRAAWMRAERRFVPSAAAVLTVSPLVASDLAGRYGVRTPETIYNGTAEVVDRPSAVHAPLRLLHLGKFFSNRGLEELIGAVDAMRGDVTLTLQGWGKGEGQLRALVEALGLEAIVDFLPPCDPEEIVACIADHDVGITNIRPENDNLRWTTANKQFEYMAAGLAQVAPGATLIGEMVERERCGVTFDSGDSLALTAALRMLAGDCELVARLKGRAALAAAKYTWAAQAETLIGVYERALGRSSDDHLQGETSCE